MVALKGPGKINEKETGDWSLFLNEMFFCCSVAHSYDALPLHLERRQRVGDRLRNGLLHSNVPDGPKSSRSVLFRWTVDWILVIFVWSTAAIGFSRNVWHAFTMELVLIIVNFEFWTEKSFILSSFMLRMSVVFPRQTILWSWSVVVALLPISRFHYQRFAVRIHSSGKIYTDHVFTVNCWKDENKRGREWPI